MNSIGGNLEMRKEALNAYISLLVKEGKDPTVCSSFRPISLIKEDIKIYARILAKRLKPSMPSLLQNDQAGFIPGREVRDNLIRTILLMNGAKK